MYKNPRATAKALALSGLADRLEQAYEDEIAAVEKAKQLAEMEKQRRADAIRHAQEAADARERQILEERRKQAQMSRSRVASWLRVLKKIKILLDVIGVENVFHKKSQIR